MQKTQEQKLADIGHLRDTVVLIEQGRIPRYISLEALESLVRHEKQFSTRTRTILLRNLPAVHAALHQPMERAVWDLLSIHGLGKVSLTAVLEFACEQRIISWTIAQYWEQIEGE